MQIRFKIHKVVMAVHVPVRHIPKTILPPCREGRYLWIPTIPYIAVTVCYHLAVVFSCLC